MAHAYRLDSLQTYKLGKKIIASHLNATTNVWFYELWLNLGTAIPKKTGNLKIYSRQFLRLSFDILSTSYSG